MVCFVYMVHTRYVPCLYRTNALYVPCFYRTHTLYVPCFYRTMHCTYHVSIVPIHCTYHVSIVPCIVRTMFLSYPYTVRTMFLSYHASYVPNIDRFYKTSVTPTLKKDNIYIYCICIIYIYTNKYIIHRREAKSRSAFLSSLPFSDSQPGYQWAMHFHRSSPAARHGPDTPDTSRWNAPDTLPGHDSIWRKYASTCIYATKNPQNMLHHKLESGQRATDYYRHTKGTWFDVVRPLKDQGWYVMDSSICMRAHKRPYLGFSGLPCISQGVERFQNARWNLNFGKSITSICNLHILEHCFEEQNLTARPHLPSCQFIAKCLMLLVNGWKAQVQVQQYAVKCGAHIPEHLL